MKTPSTNIQAPEKHQMSKHRPSPFRLGAWNFSGVWGLKFGVSDPFPGAWRLLLGAFSTAIPNYFFEITPFHA